MLADSVEGRKKKKVGSRECGKERRKERREERTGGHSDPTKLLVFKGQVFSVFPTMPCS